MAYKDFQAADVLTAQEVDQYLMRQSVMVFASATARNLALTAPTEGMMVYLEDTNRFQIFDGTSWAGFSTTGSVLADTQLYANTGGADGGAEVGAWNSFSGIKTRNMNTSTEYMMVSNGDDNFISAGAGGSVFIRAGGNSTTNQLSVTPTGTTVSGTFRAPDNPYVQMRGNGALWFQGTGRVLRDGDPGGFTWAPQYNIGNHFSTATGLLTAPRTGVYLCMFQTYQQNYGGQGYIHWLYQVGGSFAWNNGDVPYNIFGYDRGTYADGVSVNMLIYVTAGNGIGISAHMGGDERFYSNYTYFAIRYLG